METAISGLWGTHGCFEIRNNESYRSETLFDNLLADKSIATNVRFIRRKFELGSCLLLDTSSISKENRISMIGNLLSYALLRRYFEQIATENRSESRSIE